MSDRSEPLTDDELLDQFLAKVKVQVPVQVPVGAPRAAPTKVLPAQITQRGILVDGAALHAVLPARALTKLQEELTISHTTVLGTRRHTISMTQYQRHQGSCERWLFARFAGLPRLLAEYGVKLQLKNMIPPGESIPAARLLPGVDPNENQDVVLKWLAANVYSPTRVQRGSASCVLVMDTGTGKTYVGGALIEAWAKKTLVVVPGGGAQGEWEKMLAACFPTLRVGYYGTKKADGDVVIMKINSAIRDTFTVDKREVPRHEYFARFGAVILDEVHSFATQSFGEVFWRTAFTYSVYLTATPSDRADGMDAVYPRHGGQLVVAKELPGYNVEAVEWRGEIQSVGYSGPPEFTATETNRMGWVSVPLMCSKLIADPWRNALLLREIHTLYTSGKNVFVFAERRTYLMQLQTLLRAKYNIDVGVPEAEGGADARTLMGGASDEARAAALDARIILITYSYGLQSLSIPKMDALVFATPRRNKMRQTLGRILRLGGNTTALRIIVDLVDVETPMAKQARTREAVYREKGFPVTRRTVAWTEIEPLTSLTASLQPIPDNEP